MKRRIITAILLITTLVPQNSQAVCCGPGATLARIDDSSFISKDALAQLQRMYTGAQQSASRLAESVKGTIVEAMSGDEAESARAALAAIVDGKFGLDFVSKTIMNSSLFGLNNEKGNLLEQAFTSLKNNATDTLTQAVFAAFVAGQAVANAPDKLADAAKAGVAGAVEMGQQVWTSIKDKAENATLSQVKQVWDEVQAATDRTPGNIASILTKAQDPSLDIARTLLTDWEAMRNWEDFTAYSTPTDNPVLLSALAKNKAGELKDTYFLDKYSHDDLRTVPSQVNDIFAFDLIKSHAEENVDKMLSTARKYFEFKNEQKLAVDSNNPIHKLLEMATFLLGASGAVKSVEDLKAAGVFGSKLREISKITKADLNAFKSSPTYNTGIGQLLLSAVENDHIDRPYTYKQKVSTQKSTIKTRSTPAYQTASRVRYQAQIDPLSAMFGAWVNAQEMQKVMTICDNSREFSDSIQDIAQAMQDTVSTGFNTLDSTVTQFKNFLTGQLNQPNAVATRGGYLFANWLDAANEYNHMLPVIAQLAHLALDNIAPGAGAAVVSAITLNPIPLGVFSDAR